MSTEENKALVRRVIDQAWNRGEMAVVDEVLAPEHRYANAPPGVPGDAESLKANMERTRRAFPDLHFTIEEQIAEGDRVVTCFRSTGTHQGDYQTPIGVVAPTGKRVESSGVLVLRFKDGRCVETWANTDTLGLLQQLGAIPVPATAG